MEFNIKITVPDEYPAHAAETAIIRLLDRNAAGYSHRGLVFSDASDRDHRNPFVMMDDNGNRIGHAWFGDIAPGDAEQHRIERQAEATRQSLINGLEPDADEEDQITRASLYGAERMNGWTYILGGGGPTILAHCFGRGPDASVIVEVIGFGERALRAISGDTATKVADQLARASRGDL